MTPLAGFHPESSRFKARCLSRLLSGPPAERQACLRELLTGSDPGCLEALHQESLFPFLYSSLIWQDCQISAPLSLLGKFKHDYLCALQQSVVHEAEALQVIESMVAAGIGVILLKGADLRLRVYNDPAARPMTDLDLLVPPEDVAPARKVLAGLKYRVTLSHTHQRPGFREQFAPADIYEPPPGLTLKVDFHWGLWNEFSVYGLPLTPILDGARPASFRGVPVRVMAPEHLLMHLCLHAYWDGIMLRQLVDIVLTASLLPVSWPRLLDQASRWRGQFPLHQVLSLAQEVSPVAIPASTLDGLAGRRPPLVEKVVKTGALGPLTYYLASLYRQPLTQWPSFFAAKFWPDRDYLAAKFGSPSRLGYLGQFVRKFRR
ncbi:MAG: nucleotidyltransferase family protein [Desulfobaccales bacterium]